MLPVLKVLQLIPTLDRSGAEKQMALLAGGLPRDRFDVEVAALTRLGPLRDELTAAGIPLTLIGKRLKIDPFALGRLVRLLRARRFDVVQTWIFAANVYGRVAAMRAGVPVVVTAEMAVDLWKRPAHLAVDRRLAGWTDRVVGNSDAVVDFYREAGVPDDRLAMIPSGVADDEPPEVDPAAVRAEFGFPADATLVLYVGRIAPQKAVGDLITACDLLQHVEPRLRTLVVGDGPLLDRCRATAHEFQLDPRVKFLGHRADVPRLLAAADMLVLPSVYEGLPNVVLEAMRSRKPVVATAAPGTVGLVVDGETGRLVPIHDPVALATAIRDLARDRPRARRMGEAGRARVESEYRAATMVERFARLYEEIAAAKGLAVGRAAGNGQAAADGPAGASRVC